MKNLFIIFALFLTTTLALKAQVYAMSVETVYLKNGSIINGELIEQIPGESVKIKTKDGNVFVYQLDDVTRITKKQVDFLDQNLDNGPKVGYKGFVDFGYSFGVGENKIDRLEFTTSHGYQITPYLYAGVGAGLSYFQLGKAVAIPLFANPRLTLPTSSSISPFIDFKVGYTVSKYVKGFYFAPSIGARFDIQNNKAINLSLGYTLQKADVAYNAYYYDSYYNSYYSSYYEQKKNIGAITFKVGFEF